MVEFFLEAESLIQIPWGNFLSVVFPVSIFISICATQSKEPRADFNLSKVSGSQYRFPLVGSILYLHEFIFSYWNHKCAFLVRFSRRIFSGGFFLEAERIPRLDIWKDKG